MGIVVFCRNYVTYLRRFGIVIIVRARWNIIKKSLWCIFFSSQLIKNSIIGNYLLCLNTNILFYNPEFFNPLLLEFPLHTHFYYCINNNLFVEIFGLISNVQIFLLYAYTLMKSESAVPMYCLFFHNLIN